MLVAQSFSTLYNPRDCSPPGSSVHGILQARIREWVAISFSRGSSPPRDQTLVYYTAVGFLTTGPPGESWARWLEPKKPIVWGTPSWSRGRTPRFHCQEPRAQSLLGELRFYKQGGWKTPEQSLSWVVQSFQEVAQEATFMLYNFSRP